MIRHISASGLRSLHSFEMDIHPGLNVLVGPNGAGKTNIVEAFHLLTLLAKRPLSEAVGKLGGIGALVAKGADSRAGFTIAANGHRLVSREKYATPSPYSITARASLRGILRAHYRYSLTVDADVEKLRVNSETLSIWLRRVRRKGNEILDIEEDAPPDIWVRRTLDDKGTLRGIKNFRSQISSTRDYHYESQLEASLNGTSYREGDVAGDKSLLFHFMQLPKYFFPTRVLQDFDLGEPFNILPGRVREPLDVSAEPTIAHDGRGFAAAMRSLEKMSRTTAAQQEEGPSPSRFLEHVQLANPAITAFSAEVNTWDSQIRTTVELRSAGANVTVPLSALSDGTLKWVALMLAIELRTQMLAIEEPENYVHPATQMVLVDILRTYLAAPADNEFMLLTTHSETLINSLTPAEVVVVAMENGVTLTKRLDDTKRLMEEIRKTGFGLGHYYLMGALDA